MRRMVLAAGAAALRRRADGARLLLRGLLRPAADHRRRCVAWAGASSSWPLVVAAAACRPPPGRLALAGLVLLCAWTRLVDRLGAARRPRPGRPPAAAPLPRLLHRRDRAAARAASRARWLEPGLALGRVRGRRLRALGAAAARRLVELEPQRRRRGPAGAAAHLLERARHRSPRVGLGAGRAHGRRPERPARCARRPRRPPWRSGWAST